MTSSPTWRGAAVLIAALVLAVAVRAGGGDGAAATGAGLLVFAIGFWALALLPEALTGLVFLVGAVIVGVAPPAAVLAGFTTGAFWLIFAGLLLGTAVTRTGLADWLLARTLPARLRQAGRGVGYGTLVGVVVAFAGGLGFLLPATSGRVVLLVPLVLALAERAGYAAGSRGRIGLVVAGAVGTFVIPIAVLPANLPNVVLAGSLEALHGVTLTYGAYLALHYPVVAAIKGVALVVIVTVLFRDVPTPVGEGPDDAAAAPVLGEDARRLAVVLAATLALWATDVVHGVAAGWIGMAAAIVCLLPRTRILPFQQLATGPYLPLLLYVGAVLGVASVMTATGLGAALGRHLLAVVPLQGASDAAVLVWLAALGAFSGLVATMPGAPAVAVPSFPEIAALTGWSIEAIGMAQVLGYATPLFPYQVPPFVVAMAMAGIPAAAMTRTLLWLAVTTTPPMLVAAYVWWGLLGWL